jgi:predicted transcriptional regulator
MADDKPAPKPFKVGEEPRPEASGLGSQFLPRSPEDGRGDSSSTMQRRAKSRLKKMRNFIMLSMRDLRPAELRVWLALYNCEHKGLCRIGYERIAELTGVSRRHVGKAMKSLMLQGLVDRRYQGKFRPGNNKGLASIYRLYDQQWEEVKQVPDKPR